MDELNLISLAFLGASIMLSLLLVIVLLSIKKGNREAHWFLVAIIIITTFSSLSSLLMFSGLYIYSPTLVLMFYPFVFVIGPIYFCYIKLLIDESFKFKGYHLLNLIPLFYGFYRLKWFFPLTVDKKIKSLNYAWFGDYELGFKDFMVNSIPNFITILSLLISYFLIVKIALKSKDNSSNTDIEYFEWLKKFTLLYIVLTVLDIIRLALTIKFGLDAGKGEIITNVLITILIQYYIFQVIKKPEQVFYSLSISKTLKSTDTIKAITEKQLGEIDKDFVMKLSAYMLKEKPYLKPELKSHELAIMLDVTPHYLSRIINQEFDLNFYSFVNQYRVEEFKIRVLLSENENLTLIAIAKSVGFNSKSSFNRIFKSIMLITPNEYLKQNLGSQPT